MRSIKNKYKKIQAQNPNLGSYICLARVSTGEKYSRKSLASAFK
jgi:hypothetical protein